MPDRIVIRRPGPRAIAADTRPTETRPRYTTSPYDPPKRDQPKQEKKLTTDGTTMTGDDGNATAGGRAADERRPPAVVEETLRCCAGVRDAYAAYVPTHGGDVVVAWAATDDGDAARAAHDRIAGPGELEPRHIPAVIVPVAAIPRDGAGAVVAGDLPEPAGTPTGTIDPPAGDAETRVAEAAGAATGVRFIGRNDNLFALGLDSVRAISMAAALGRDGIAVTPRRILEDPTVAGIAACAGEPERAATPASDTAVSGLDEDQLAALLADDRDAGDPSESPR
ncbi:phosphopantetheine-binding protein [Corynebacterium freneyi]|uniref:phosphopantetheine-binding protein n=1 Tax=Corynebacterium freneyi TaxID=134034 RepID=UPI001EF319D6|nr:phosphopantetheine-binding protein [Corynebacterium freneyi]